MAPSTLLLVIALAFTISLQASNGNKMIECENLDENSCSYAVSSAGKRCVLEKRILIGSGYTCRTSEIEADSKLRGLIETKECVDACSVDRKDLGISSDYFLEPTFVERLCSDECYSNCPNIVDLFFNLAAGEGVYLPKVCRARRSNGRREMLEVNGGGDFPQAYAPAQASGLRFSQSDVAASPS